MRTLLTPLLIILGLYQLHGQDLVLMTELESVKETSGLINLQGRIITHNDSGGEAALYEIDTVSGDIIRTVQIANASNKDWEDISYDEEHIYIGDFGNNEGSRRDLMIYRISITDYLNTQNDSLSADVILFEYADQTDYTPSRFSTNFDAEALINIGDSLYVFTKNWGDNHSNVYSLPNEPGNYSAPRIDRINTEALVTGASYDQETNKVILVGYGLNAPFFSELINLATSGFKAGSANKVSLTMPADYSFQVEAISKLSDSQWVLSAEESFSGNAGLFSYKPTPVSTHENNFNFGALLYPNPTRDILSIKKTTFKTGQIIDENGRLVLSFSSSEVDISSINSGIYFVHLLDQKGEVISSNKLIID